VVVPTDKHCEVAVPLLEKRVHLLIEKPLCEDLEEAQKILEAARKNNCVVQVGHIEHFNPVMEFLEDMVNKPRFITADRLAPFNPRGTEVGVVLDLMIHDIGIILQLNPSPIEKIESVGVRVLSSTEDIANASLEFENGCVANLTSSRISLKNMRKSRFFQKDAYVSVDFLKKEFEFLQMESLKTDPDPFDLIFDPGEGKAKKKDQDQFLRIPFVKIQILFLRNQH
jgi:predicted dehydrogenase